MKDFLLQFTALHDPKRLENIARAIVSGDRNLMSKAHTSIQNFFAAPYHLAPLMKDKDSYRASIQNFMVKGDIPDFNTSMFDSFIELAAFDRRWQDAFKKAPIDEGKDYFEIASVENLFTFDLLPEGARVTLKEMSIDRAIVNISTYAEGFGWTFEMIEDRRFGVMVQLAEEFRKAWFLREAKIYYGLIMDAAVSGSNANSGSAVTYSAVGSNTLEKDIITLDTAANIIGTAVKDLGVMADPAMGELLIYCQPKHYSRLLTATGYSSLANVNSSVTTQRRFRVIPTYNLVQSNGTAISTNNCVMCVPQGKTQYAEKIPLTTYNRTDIESFSQVQTARVRTGGAIGEPKQFVSVALA